MESDIFALTRGTAPLLVSVPHAGVHIPSALERRMTPAALQRADVDVLAMQETKCTDDQFPAMPFLGAGKQKVADVSGG